MDYQKNKMTSEDNEILHKLYYLVCRGKRKYLCDLLFTSHNLMAYEYLR